MSEPFLAEIPSVGFNYASPGWAFGDGRILPTYKSPISKQSEPPTFGFIPPRPATGIAGMGDITELHNETIVSCI